MNRFMIAAAAVAVMATGTANAAPKKHMKSQPSSSERAATKQLNEQQLAAATTGQSAGPMRSEAPPAPGAMPPPAPADTMAPPPAPDGMTPPTPPTPPQG